MSATLEALQPWVDTWLPDEAYEGVKARCAHDLILLIKEHKDKSKENGIHFMGAKIDST